MDHDRRKFLAGSLAATLASPWLGCAAGREVAWLADVQKAPDVLPPDSPALSDLRVDDQGRPIVDLASWVKHRPSILKWWREFLGVIERAPKAPALEVLEEDRPEGVLRQRVRYESEPGMTCEAYLIRPQAPAGRRPGVAVFHSTVDHTIRQPAGLQGPAELAFGLNLARAGCVTFSPVNFLWVGEGNYDQRVEQFRQRHPGSRGMAKMFLDGQVALDILASLPEVDPNRLGAVGHSLGAKEVLYLAALDERVKATVSSEGGVGMDFSNWDAPWYLGPEIQREDFTREHHELLALAAPNPFLLVGGDSADGDRSWPFIARGLEVYPLYGSPSPLGLLNHRQGHAVPPEAAARIQEWLLTYLE